MTLRTSFQKLIRRDPARLSLRERAAETAARLAASKPATDAATADLPPQVEPDAVLAEAAANLHRVEATIAAIPTAPGQDLDDMPASGRIVAVADVFDALVSERPYKTAWPLDRARSFVADQAGLHFDPRCVDAFLKDWGDVEEQCFRPAA